MYCSFGERQIIFWSATWNTPRYQGQGRHERGGSYDVNDKKIMNGMKMRKEKKENGRASTAAQAKIAMERKWKPEKSSSVMPIFRETHKIVMMHCKVDKILCLSL